MSLKILSLNCRGLGKKLKRRLIFNICKSYDVSCLQETYITKSKYEEWKNEWNGDLIYYNGTTHSKGQIILIKESLTSNISSTHHISDRILGIDLNINDTAYSILNIYSPCIGKEKSKTGAWSSATPNTLAGTDLGNDKW